MMSRLFVLLTVFLSVTALTVVDQIMIETTILKPFLDQNALIDLANGISGDTQAGIVRLIFHDCATWDPASKTGGCHGCLAIQCTVPNACEYTASENNGLQKPVNQLEALYVNNSLNTILSRIDFWALASKYAIEYSSDFNVTLPYYYGRTDCPACPLPRFPNRLPSHQGGQTAINDVFFERLGFSAEETVALMGAHSLGRCNMNHTGVSGHWDRKPNVWNNQYFQSLNGAPWIRGIVISSDGSENLQFQIPGAPTTVMLTTDMALLVEDILNTTCNTTFSSDDCPFNPVTGPYVQKFAASNDEFNTAFQGAFTKLQSFGNTNLKVPDSVQPPCSGSGRVSQLRNRVSSQIPKFFPENYRNCNATDYPYQSALPPAGFIVPQFYPAVVRTAAPPVAKPSISQRIYHPTSSGSSSRTPPTTPPTPTPPTPPTSPTTHTTPPTPTPEYPKPTAAIPPTRPYNTPARIHQF